MILIVDDSRADAARVRAALVRRGIDERCVKMASSAEEGERILEHSREVNLLIADWNLKGEFRADGRELLEWARGRNKGLWTLLVSSLPDVISRVKTWSANGSVLPHEAVSKLEAHWEDACADWAASLVAHEGMDGPETFVSEPSLRRCERVYVYAPDWEAHSGLPRPFRVPPALCRDDFPVVMYGGWFIKLSGKFDKPVPMLLARWCSLGRRAASRGETSFDFRDFFWWRQEDGKRAPEEVLKQASLCNVASELRNQAGVFNRQLLPALGLQSACNEIPTIARTTTVHTSSRLELYATASAPLVKCPPDLMRPAGVLPGLFRRLHILFGRQDGKLFEAWRKSLEFRQFPPTEQGAVSVARPSPLKR